MSAPGTESSEDAALEPAAPEPAGICFDAGPCERTDGGDCSRCALVCPAHAVSFGADGGVCIDEDACTGCAICVGICDAFSSSAVTTYDFAKRLQRKAEEHGELYLCCEEDVFEGLDPASNVVVLPCLASLPPELLAYLLAHRATVVLAHDLGYCEGCSRGGRFADRLWRRSFELAQDWTAREIRFAQAIPENERLSDKMAFPDRRGLFTHAIAAAGDVASGRYRASKQTAVEEFLARRDKMRAATRSMGDADLFLGEDARVAAHESQFPRKRLLKEALAADPAMAGRLPTAVR